MLNSKIYIRHYYLFCYKFASIAFKSLVSCNFICKVKYVVLDIVVDLCKLEAWPINSRKFNKILTLSICVLQYRHSDTYLLWLLVLTYPILHKLDLILSVIYLWFQSLFREVCDKSILDNVWAASGLELGALLENFLVW